MKKKISIISSLCVLVAILVFAVVWKPNGNEPTENININEQITADNGVKYQLHIYINAAMHHKNLYYDIYLADYPEKRASVLIKDPDKATLKEPMEQIEFIVTEKDISRYLLGDAIVYIGKDVLETQEIDTTQKTEHYKIIKDNNMLFSYFLYGKDRKIVKWERDLSKPPRIDVIENRLIKVTKQAGTGIATQHGYFYDLDTNKSSESFYAVADQYGNRVALIEKDKVIIRDIFNKEGFYTAISDFSKPLSECAEPIVSAEFSDDGKNLEIVYLTGKDFAEAKEEIPFE